MADRSDLSCDCLGGGTAYVAHGDAVVLLAFTEDVGWWRNAVCLAPSEARRLAAILTEQADRSDEITADSTEGPESKVVDLMEALIQSVEAARSARTEGDET